MKEEYGAADQLHQEFKSVSPNADILDSMQDFEDDESEYDNVSSTESLLIYRGLDEQKRIIFRQLTNDLFGWRESDASETSLDSQKITEALPRKAIEVAVLDNLRTQGPSSRWSEIKELLGGDEAVITTEEGRELALKDLVSYYMGEEFGEGSDMDWYKKFTGISAEEARNATIRTYVEKYNYALEDTGFGTGFTQPEFVCGPNFLELKITPEELNTEASMQVEAEMRSEGDPPWAGAERALELAAVTEISQAALEKLKAYEDLESLMKPLKFIKYIGSYLEQNLPEFYEQQKANLLACIGEDLDVADYFIENLRYMKEAPWLKDAALKALEFNAVADKLNYSIYYDNWHFSWLDEIKEATHFDEFIADIESDQSQEGHHYHHYGNQGFSEANPHPDHPNTYTARQKKLATAFFKAMSGKTAKQPGELDFEPTEITAENSFKMHEIISHRLDRLSERMFRDTSAPEIDRIFIRSERFEGIKLQPLRITLMRLLSRYLAQTSQDNNEWNKPLSADRLIEIEVLVDEGISKWVDAYSLEIPLYDKLYEQFDEMRHHGDEISEIYLGRDGIYAYLGRRAQAAVRNQRPHRGHNQRVKLDYLVYPRQFRDSLNGETKREYIEHEGLSETSNPHFYDTGFTGTIPADIMEVMGFTREEIDRRIHLLSASNPERRVRGIPENARHDIVNSIEGNVKMENSAIGLLKHPESGAIEPIAEPTSPREQFLYLFLRQAFVRHYYLKEKVKQMQGAARKEELQPA